MEILKYFNLNVPLSTPKVEEVINQLNLGVEKSESKEVKREEAVPAVAAPPPPPPPQMPQMKLWEQILIYIGLAVGVLLSNAVFQFKAGNLTTINISSSSIIISLVISLIILPYVFGKLNVDAKSPVILRFSLAVQQGVFWQVIFNAFT